MVFFFAEKQAVSGSDVETGTRQESVKRGHRNLGVEPVDTPASLKCLHHSARLIAAVWLQPLRLKPQSSHLVMDTPSAQ